MTEPLASLAQALADRYRLDRELGAGGMATVYLAEDLRHHRKVAIKVLHPELSAVLGPERFLKEIELTANLQHPHILPLFDSGNADGLLYYVMPYVEGESLRSRLTREKQLPISDAVRIATEAASALDYAHRRGVVHRDIKPENILLHDGRALVADFGIALAVQQAGGSRMTQTGMSLGTPQYMSPEQAMGEREITARSDIYALGCVTYEMLVGEPPFTGPTAQAIVAKVMTDEPRPLSQLRKNVPPHVEDAVHIALEKLSADRFGSAAELAEALGGHPSGRVLGRRGARPPRDDSPIRRFAWVGWAAAAGLGAFAAWGWLQDGEPPIEAGGTTRRAAILVQGMGDVRSSLTSLTVSADGTLLVYGALRGSSVALHARRLDALEAEPIRGTEGSQAPFLTRDGHTLGFLRDGDLFVVPSTGGSPAKVRGASALEEGVPDWTPDGRIVYTDERGDLVLVYPDGSASDTLTRAESPERHVSPAVLPDGRTVLYTIAGPDVNETQIAAVTIATRRSRSLVSGGAITPQYADGFLLYVRPDGPDGTLMAARFDPGKGEVEGEPVAMGDQVNRTRFSVAHFRAATGLLLYVPGAKNRLVEVTRSGRSVPLLAEVGNWHHPRYSPDGSRVVLDQTSPGGSDRDVWILDRGASTLSRVTRIGDAHDPTWLPNGREVSFFSFKLGGSPLKVAAADGGGEPASVVVSGGFTATDLVNPGAWLPDGSAYVGSVSAGGGRPADIWLIPRDGAAPTRLVGSEYEEYEPAVSADGRWLAYQSHETGRAEVYIRSLTGGAGRLQVSNGGGTEPVWDRRRAVLYYIEPAGDRIHLMAATLRTSPSIAVTAREVVIPDLRLEESDNHANYDVHPSGDRFVLPEPEPSTGLVAVFDWVASLRRAGEGTAGPPR